MIIDSHVHAWPRWPYEPPVPDDATRGSYPNLLFEMDRSGVDLAMIVSARIERSQDNDAYGAEAVAAHPARFVSFVDLDSRWSTEYHTPGVVARLESLIAAHRPVGVSHYLGPEDDGWLRSPDADAVLAIAERERMLVSFAAPPVWFPDLRRLAERHPTVDILVNHLAVVMLHPGGIDQAMRIVFADGPEPPNLLVKTSGYYYGSDRPWDFPYTDRMWIAKSFFDRWGPSRMVWCSDWPSVLAHSSYRQSIEVLREHAGFLSADDLAALLGGNMERALSRRGRLS